MRPQTDPSLHGPSECDNNRESSSVFDKFSYYRMMPVSIVCVKTHERRRGSLRSSDGLLRVLKLPRRKEDLNHDIVEPVMATFLVSEQFCHIRHVKRISSVLDFSTFDTNIKGRGIGYSTIGAGRFYDASTRLGKENAMLPEREQRAREQRQRRRGVLVGILGFVGMVYFLGILWAMFLYFLVIHWTLHRHGRFISNSTGSSADGTEVVPSLEAA